MTLLVVIVLFCEVYEKTKALYFVCVEYLDNFVGYKPPSLSCERIICTQYLYFNHTILQLRKPASLKTFQPHSVP